VDELRRAVLGLGKQSAVLGSIYSQCFPKQLAYCADSARYKAALTSRRAGKTQAIVRSLVAAALKVPETIVVYFATTNDSADKIIWSNPEGLPAWLRKNRIECHIQEDMSVTFPNKSIIWVTGAKGRNECERWRGIRTELVAIDEAQAFTDDILSYLIDEVLSPTMMDRGGQLSLNGTPHGRCSGYFHDATTDESKGWSVHHWTWKENPHLRNAQAWIDDERRRRGLTDETPAFRREFRGEWVREDSSLAYRFSPDRNLFESLPVAPEWTTILGIDIGYNDAAAFSLGCYHSHAPIYYVREVYQEKQCTVTRYDQIINSYKQANEINKIVMDCGALGKTIAAELMQHFGHFIIPAEKVEKKTWMAFTNDALRTGNIKVHPKRCAELISQWNTLQVDEYGDEDQSMANDLSDATLYAFRHARPYLFQPQPGPKTHPARRKQIDPEVIAAQMQARAEEYVERQQAAQLDVNGLLGEYETIGAGLFE
jgi:hypothetical protein